MGSQWYDCPITGSVISRLLWVMIIVQSWITASTHILSPDLWGHWYLNTANCTNLFSLQSLQSLQNPIFELWSWLQTHIIFHCVTAQGWHPFPYLIDINPLAEHAISNFKTHSPSHESNSHPIALCYSKNHGFRWHRFDWLHPRVCRHTPKMDDVISDHT